MCDGGFVFEGPEKRLEIIFRVDPTNSVGLRKYKQDYDKLLASGLEGLRDPWQLNVLDDAKCTILNVTSNEFFDAYVLSESSLFVFPYKIMIKTCGTTRLLSGVPKMVEMAAAVGTEPEFVKYSRKNFNFPNQQPEVYRCFENETKFLTNIFGDNQYFTFGSDPDDHYHLFIAEKNGRSVHRPERNLEIMMSELDRTAMKQFYNNGQTTGKEVTKSSGLYDAMSGYIHDESLFEPCGYSVNGLKGEHYYTVHVTPEAGFSYVSFETNQDLPSYIKLIRKIIGLFKPGKFCMSLLLEHTSEDFHTVQWDCILPGYEIIHEEHQPFDDFKVVYCSFKSLHLATTPDCESCGA